MRERRKAAALAGFSVASLVGGLLAGAAFPQADTILVVAGFAGYGLCGRRAMRLWQADDQVFARRDTSEKPRARPVSAVAAGLMIGTIASFAMGQAARPRREQSRRGSTGRGSSTPLRFPQSADARPSETSE